VKLEIFDNKKHFKQFDLMELIINQEFIFNQVFSDTEKSFSVAIF